MRPVPLLLGALLGSLVPASSLPAQNQGDDVLPPDIFVEGFGPAAGKAAAPEAEAPALVSGTRDEATRLLRDPRVVLLKVTRWFRPSESARRAAVLDVGKGWLALRGGKVLGWFADLDEELVNEAGSRAVDLTARSDSAFLTPGFCDADSRWFRADADLGDSGQNLSVAAADRLELWQEGWEELPRKSGVTTLYVPAGVAARSAGAGVVVSLGTTPRVVERAAASSYKVSTVQTRGTNLSRDGVTKTLEKELEDAKKYREAKEKYDKDLEEYEKKRKEFLAYYKQHPMKAGEEPAEEQKPAADEGRQGRRGRGMRMTPEQVQEMRKLPPEERQKYIDELRKKQQGGDEGAKEPEKPAEAKADGKAPPRPKRPKEPDVDPQKEAMLEVLDGKRMLRLEVHRAGEIQAVLALKKEHGLDKVVLVGATEAWKVAKQIAEAGCPVVLRPEETPEAAGFELLPEHLPAQAARLAEAGVPVCFGSGGRREAGVLPLLAACAVGSGMSEEDALEALTKNAWLASGGEGDVMVVYDKDPLAPDAKVLAVIDNQAAGARRPGRGAGNGRRGARGADAGGAGEGGGR
ncbi:MAG: hypothetical protein R3F30_06980 [Planctomycetota bacterium]